MTGDIISAIKAIRDWLQLGVDQQRLAKEDEREALLALYKAVNETRIFFHDTDDHKLGGVDEKS